MNYGEIYIITNKKNNKSYIGQAKKWVGKFDKEWGTKGRVDSHFREAVCGKQDHCRLLNNAIRKYGKQNFSSKKICDCKDKKDMDEKEDKYIDEYNTLVPNGYNLNKGGYTGCDSEETKEKKRISHLGKKHSEDRRNNISKGQIGNRRLKKKRKYPEDNELPKYISADRKKGILVGYLVKGFPIGIENKEYSPKKGFLITKKRSKEDALKQAIEYVNLLKEKYKNLQKDIVEEKVKETKKKIITKKTEIQLDDLPKYVYPIYNTVTTNKIGYYVEGILDNNGKPYPRKDFTDKKTNKWNLFGATEYIKSLEIKNKDEKFKVPEKFEKSRRRKYDGDDNNLPKYVSFVRSKGVKIGYNIAIPSIIKPNGKKYTKKFADKKLTMEEKLCNCIKTLEEVKKEHNIK